MRNDGLEPATSEGIILNSGQGAGQFDGRQRHVVIESKNADNEPQDYPKVKVGLEIKVKHRLLPERLRPTSDLPPMCLRCTSDLNWCRQSIALPPAKGKRTGTSLVET